MYSFVSAIKPFVDFTDSFVSSLAVGLKISRDKIHRGGLPYFSSGVRLECFKSPDNNRFCHFNMMRTDVQLEQQTPLAEMVEP